jgi:hypothetical protein
MKAHLIVEASDLAFLRTCLIKGAASLEDEGYVMLHELVEEIDRHRPSGSDGKHGNLHTTTCGCEDKC